VNDANGEARAVQFGTESESDMSDQDRPLSILHLIMSLRPTNGQYNEHCLPFAQQRSLAICCFFKASIEPIPEIAVFEGDGTLRGFWRALRRALDHRSYDVIHAHAPQTAVILLVANLFLRRSISNSICTIQNSFRSYRLRNQLLLFPIFTLFPKIILCSNAALQSMPRFLRWLGRSRMDVIQNGVDTDRVDRVLANFDTGAREDGFTVVSVGRIIARKNPIALLRAFERSRDPDSRLLYVGDGDSRSQLLEEVDRLGLGAHVAVTGLVDRDDVYRFVAAGDVNVSFSHSEGLPVAVLEAMACGRPVILSDIPPHREIAGDVSFVPLIARDDVAGLARELRRLREMPPEQRVDLGERCRKLVEQRFSLKMMHRTYERIYERIIRRRFGTESDRLRAQESGE
jgi:glycosyltransferase involved in cell wall biosynthesis